MTCSVQPFILSFYKSNITTELTLLLGLALFAGKGNRPNTNIILIGLTLTVWLSTKLFQSKLKINVIKTLARQRREQKVE